MLNRVVEAIAPTNLESFDKDAFDDDNGEENEDDDDEDDELFLNSLRNENDIDALALCTAGSIVTYYHTYVHKVPCMDSYQTGMRWLSGILEGHWKRSVNMFRMDASILRNLCSELQSKYRSKPSKRMNVIDKVAMFLCTLALGAPNMEVQERFQH